MFGNFARQIRPGQHTDACLGCDFFEDLAHQLEAVCLDTFGRADQLLARQLRGKRLQRLAQRAGRQCDEDQFACIQGLRQIGGRLHLRQDGHALEIARVLPLTANALSLLGVAHPEPDVVPVLRQQIGDRSTETAAAEHGDGLLSCHVVTVMSHSRWQ
ncbi:hypothetical protein SSTU70S_07092 [Stutzerimonas stutzeri]